MLEGMNTKEIYSSDELEVDFDVDDKKNRLSLYKLL